MKHKKYNYKCHELIRWTAAALLQNCMRRLKNYKVLVLRSINEQTSRNWETVSRTHGEVGHRGRGTVYGERWDQIGWWHGVFFLNILGSAALGLVAKLEEMGSGWDRREE